MAKHIVGVLLVDTIASMKEFEDIVLGLLKWGFSLEISLRHEPEGDDSWQIIISKS